MHRQSCFLVFCSNKLNQFSWTLPFCFFCKNVSSGGTSGTHPRGKAVQVSDPAIGLCRKILRFAILSAKDVLLTAFIVRCRLKKSVVDAVRFALDQFLAIGDPIAKALIKTESIPSLQCIKITVPGRTFFNGLFRYMDRNDKFCPNPTAIANHSPSSFKCLSFMGKKHCSNNTG